MENVKTSSALVFPECELLDLFGPLEMFGALTGRVKVVTVAEFCGAVKSAQGPAVLAEHDFSGATSSDFLLVPGGWGTRSEVENVPLLEYLRREAARAELVMSVCTGAALLAAAGVLDGLRATTNKRLFP